MYFRVFKVNIQNRDIFGSCKNLNFLGVVEISDIFWG